MTNLPRKRPRPGRYRAGPRPGEGSWSRLGALGGYPLGVNTTDVSVTQDTALTLPALFACVKVVCQDLGALPFRLIQTMPNKKRRVASEHAAQRLMSWSPDGGNTTPMAWRMAFLLHYLVWGNAYAEVVRGMLGAGDPVAFELRDPQAVSVEYDADVRLWYRLGGNRVDRSQVVHAAALSKNGVEGYSPVLLARQALALGFAGERHAGSFLTNGLQASGFLETPPTMTPEAKAELAAGVLAMTSGENAWNLAVLPDGVRWHATSTDPDKAQLLETRRAALLDACRITCVPPHRVMEYSHVAYSTLEQSDLQYAKGTLIPIGTSVEQAFNLRTLTLEEVADGYGWQHDYTQLIRGDSAARTNQFRTMHQSGVIDGDTWATAEGFDPYVGGDKHLQPLNMVDASLASKAPGGVQA